MRQRERKRANWLTIVQIWSRYTTWICVNSDGIYHCGCFHISVARCEGVRMVLADTWYSNSKLRKEIWAKACRASRSKDGETLQLWNLSFRSTNDAEVRWDLYPAFSQWGFCAYLLLGGRHGISDKGVKGFWVRVSLHVWGHGLGVLPEVTLESTTLPSPFCLNYIRGDAP